MHRYRFIFSLILLLAVETNYSQVDTTIILAQFSSSSLLTDKAFYATSGEEKDEAKSLSFYEWEFLTGQWNGYRNQLIDYGIDLVVGYKADFLSNLRGGTRNGSVYLDNTDIILSFDLEKSLGLAGSSLVTQFLGNSGGSPNELVGSSMGLSNIETTPTWKLYQILFEQSFFDNKFSVAAGLYDYNSEFDNRESSALFINPSHGIGDDISKSGVNGPSIFPTTSVSLRLKYQNQSFYLLSAIMDGVPGHADNPYGTHIIFNKRDGLLTAMEFGFVNSIDEKLNYKLGIGAWRYSTKSLNNNFWSSGEIELSNPQNNFGIYITAERNLFSSSTGEDMMLFGRIGYANKNVNPVTFYAGSGLYFRGFNLVGKDNEFGIAFAFSRNSDSYRNFIFNTEGDDIKPFELNIEATYLFGITPWMKLQPDIQYIINPSYCPSTNNCVVVGSRLLINF